jgi:hypothetical protein
MDNKFVLPIILCFSFGGLFLWWTYRDFSREKYGFSFYEILIGGLGLIFIGIYLLLKTLGVIIS